MQLCWWTIAVSMSPTRGECKQLADNSSALLSTLAVRIRIGLFMGRGVMGS